MPGANPTSEELPKHHQNSSSMLTAMNDARKMRIASRFSPSQGGTKKKGGMARGAFAGDVLDEFMVLKVGRAWIPKQISFWGQYAQYTREGVQVYIYI